MAQTTTSTLTTPDSITWHIERTGSGPNHLILIPDGLGDAGLFSRAIPVLGEAEEFTITTFDMPGMCRSNKAPESTYTDVTPQKLAQYIVTLMDALEIKVASFWGCSSGGSTVLALIAHHPERVKSAMAHEVPTYAWPDLLAFETMSDKDICDTLETMLPKGMMGPNVDAWFGMGEEFHARLRKNYPLWARGYPRTLGSAFPVDKEILGREGRGKLDWSVGGATPMAVFFDNVVTATELGVPIQTLPGSHFPYVTDHEAWAKYVIGKTRARL